MAECLTYAILGRGRWARRMHGILAQHSAATIVEETRRRMDEGELDYRERMSASLAATDAGAVWICVPPGANTLLLASAAIDRGMHVVIEKPWIWDGQIAGKLSVQADDCGVILGVHYEYCLLNAVERLRSQCHGLAGLEFRGVFTTSGPDRLSIPAMHNLGSHLFAIRNYAVPEATIKAISCGYNREDRRTVSVSTEGGLITEIDFTANQEPLIQRYIAGFEKAATGRAAFPFTLEFAAKVWETLDTFPLETA